MISFFSFIHASDGNVIVIVCRNEQIKCKPQDKNKTNKLGDHNFDK